MFARQARVHSRSALTYRWIVVAVVAGLVTAGGAALPGASATPPDPPAAAGYFQVLPPGSALPTDSQCAAKVHQSAWEPRAAERRLRTTPLFRSRTRWRTSVSGAQLGTRATSLASTVPSPARQMRSSSGWRASGAGPTTWCGPKRSSSRAGIRARGPRRVSRSRTRGSATTRRMRRCARWDTRHHVRPRSGSFR